MRPRPRLPGAPPQAAGPVGRPRGTGHPAGPQPHRRELFLEKICLLLFDSKTVIVKTESTCAHTDGGDSQRRVLPGSPCAWPPRRLVCGWRAWHREGAALLLGARGWGDGILPQGGKPKPEGTKPKLSQGPGHQATKGQWPWEERTGEATRDCRSSLPGRLSGLRAGEDRAEGPGRPRQVGGVTAEARGRTAQRDERAACSRSPGQDRCPCQADGRPLPARPGLSTALGPVTLKTATIQLFSGA